MTENCRVKTAMSFAVGFPPNSSLKTATGLLFLSVHQQNLLAPERQCQRLPAIGAAFAGNLFTLAILALECKHRHKCSPYS